MRIFGYIVGFMLLGNGLMTAAAPHWWTEFSGRGMDRVIPGDQTSMVGEFNTLSSGTLRYAGFWESAVGLAVLAIASRVRR